jgi:hypothetical protein
MPNFVEKKCVFCERIFSVLFKNRNKQKFCSRECVNSKQKGEGNPAFGKRYRSKELNPEWAASIAAGCCGVNAGDKNGMKKPEARAKASQTRKQMMQSRELREEISAQVRKAWADGKYEGVRVGQCKWFSFKKKDGTTIKLQGTWELAFAKWADEKSMTFATHKGRLAYVMDGQTKSYYPDFFVEDWGCYVDIKNDYHMQLQKDKFQAIQSSNPNVKIRILGKEDLKQLGVSLRTDGLGGRWHH